MLIDLWKIIIYIIIKIHGKSINNSCITACLKGRQKTAFDYVWKYKE